MEFTLERFVIKPTPLSQNQTHSRSSIGSFSSLPPSTDLGPEDDANAGFRLNSGNARRLFASFSHVESHRSACRFCSLAYQAVERYSGSKVDGEAGLFLSWEVDGRQILDEGRIVNRTRRIRMTWRDRNGKEETVYVVFVSPSGASRYRSDTNPTTPKSADFLGREIMGTDEKQTLLKSWVDLCVNSHGPNCQNKHGERSEFRTLIKGTYFGVLDVIDMQLKELPMVDDEPKKYVALSYVWGKHPSANKSYVTTRSNVMSRIQPRGLQRAWDRLPRTIQDAIRLVRHLGERYLWVDSLCIVQDSLSSWELNAKSMHLVYGNAHFTICAADGDAESGLRAAEEVLRTSHPAARPLIRRHSHGSSGLSPFDFPALAEARKRQRSASPSLGPKSNSPPAKPKGVSVDEGRAGIQASIYEQFKPITAEILPGIRLLVSRPPEAVIQDSPWNQRGWTFQERLLSRRCLIFAEGQVYFQCRSTVISQHIFTGGTGGADRLSLDWTNSSLRTLGELRRRAFWFYMKCIHLYTGRWLTKPKDVLTAFEGVSWLLQQQMNAPLFYGLPMSHFDLALLWTPMERLDRRIRKSAHSSTSGCTQDAMGNCSCKQEDEGFGDKEFPSWSWCGWQGGKAEYRVGMIDGCLVNVQQWLRQHSWIQWYVRDYEGDLRPLWDRNMLREDQSEERRWRGYAGGPPPRAQVQPPRSPSRQSPVRPIAASMPRPPIILEHTMPPPRPTSTPGSWSRSSNTAYLDRLPDGYYDNEDEDARLAKRRSARLSTRFDGSGVASSRYYEMPIAPYKSQIADRTKDREASYLDAQRHRRNLFDGVYERNPPVVTNSQPEEAPRYPNMRRRPPGRYRRGSRGFSTDSSSDTDSRSDRKENQRHNDEQYVEGGLKEPEEEDTYGRPPRPKLKGRNASEFTGILPDNPFGIIRGPFPDDPRDHARAMPILQFWTWRAELFVSARQTQVADDTGTSTSLSPHTDAHSKLVQCDIVDNSGDWCGAITLSSDWFVGREGTPLLFIALSDAKMFTNEECPMWNYYIPKEKEESEWDLFYVMLLERNRERALWERVAVGKVFQAAFGDAVWDEIKLG